MVFFLHTSFNPPLTQGILWRGWPRGRSQLIDQIETKFQRLPPFLGSSYIMILTGTLYDQPGNRNLIWRPSKVAKTEVLISQLVDQLGTRFKRRNLCFWGSPVQCTHTHTTGNRKVILSSLVLIFLWILHTNLSTLFMNNSLNQSEIIRPSLCSFSFNSVCVSICYFRCCHLWRMKKMNIIGLS